MDGDQVEAISRLYERHAAAVHRYASRRSDPDTADEVTAQVFLVAWRRRSGVPEDALPWLYGVARRVLADQRRGASRRLRLRDRLRGASLEHAPALELPDRGLASALRHLSESDREVLLLRYWEELAPAQVARVMGCSRAAATVRLHRARTRLRTALEAEPDEHADAGEQGRPCVVKAESA
jgi:RNA polymerase sigma-70 factor (ECF subfamily)